MIVFFSMIKKNDLFFFVDLRFCSSLQIIEIRGKSQQKYKSMKLLFPVVLFYTTFGVDRSTFVISTLQKTR